MIGVIASITIPQLMIPPWTMHLIFSTASWVTLGFNSCLVALLHFTCNHGTWPIWSRLFSAAEIPQPFHERVYIYSTAVQFKNYIGFTSLPYYFIKAMVTFPPCSHKPPLHSVNSLPLPVLYFPFTITSFFLINLVHSTNPAISPLLNPSSTDEF